MNGNVKNVSNCRTWCAVKKKVYNNVDDGDHGSPNAVFFSSKCVHFGGDSTILVK
jgi:hypothetical protein